MVEPIKLSAHSGQSLGHLILVTVGYGYLLWLAFGQRSIEWRLCDGILAAPRLLLRSSR